VLRQLASTLLTQQGFEAEEVADADEALASIGANGAPQLMILDLGLPGMGGRELLGRLRAVDALRRMPIIILTGSADDYLRKSIDPPKFVARVKAAARRAQLR
jgi:two-component system KDP operon response regulator KdpE